MLYLFNSPSMWNFQPLGQKCNFKSCNSRQRKKFFYNFSWRLSNLWGGPGRFLCQIESFKSCTHIRRLTHILWLQLISENYFKISYIWKFHGLWVCSFPKKCLFRNTGTGGDQSNAGCGEKEIKKTKFMTVLENLGNISSRCEQQSVLLYWVISN